MSQNESRPATAFFVVRLIAYRPLQFAVVALSWILFHSWPLLPGLLAKAAMIGEARATRVPRSPQSFLRRILK